MASPAFLKRMSLSLLSLSDSVLHLSVKVFLSWYLQSMPWDPLETKLALYMATHNWHYPQALSSCNSEYYTVRRTFHITYLPSQVCVPLLVRSIVEGLFHVGSCGSFWWNVMTSRLCWSLLGPSACLVHSHFCLV